MLQNALRHAVKGAWIADTFRYKFGETNPAQLPWKSTVSVQIGDLVFEDDTDAYTVKPAASYPWSADGLSATQVAFAAKFAGVSMQRYDSARQTGVLSTQIGVQDGFLRFATNGIFEFDIADSTTVKLGDFVGPAQQAGVNLLENQKVVKVTAKANAIGRVERNPTAGATKVLVRLYTIKLGPN